MLERLKKLRERAGISQKNLAESIGVSQQSINQYENHSVEPDIGTLTRMADYFDTSVDYLIGHSDVDHRIEEWHACDLNPEELAFIQAYRRLSKKQRESLFMVTEGFLEK